MEPKSTTSMLALPNELLEKIARLLDETSVYTLAACHPRLRDICRGKCSMESIRSTHIHHVLMDFATSAASGIRSLDLSNCWTGSKEIRSLIQECHYLSDLNVVNSALTLDDLLEALKNLTVLKQLSATIIHAGEALQPSEHQSIEEIYFEFSASETDAKFVIEFLRACPSAKKLFLMVLGNDSTTISADDVDCDGESLSKYETVVIHGDPRHGWSYDDIFSLIFENPSLIYTLEARNIPAQAIFWYERENFMPSSREVPIPITPRPGTLSQMYRSITYEELRNIPATFRSQKILGLRTQAPHRRRGLPMHLHTPLDVLATVVELDLLASHVVFSAQAWQALVDSSPAVQALALPSCSMLTTVMYADPLFMDDNIMETIMKLKLKTLLIRSFSPDACKRCYFVELSGKLMAYMSESVTLDELILDGARLSGDFFDLLKKPLSIRTLKMSVLSMWDDNSFIGFLRLCPKLRNLKLEAPDLPISSEFLWHAFSSASLKQLCVFSRFSAPMQLSKLRISFFWLFKTLVIFHLHASHIPNFKEVKSLLGEEVAIANLAGRLDPVRCIVTQRSPAAERDAQGRRFLGRSLCCMDNFLGIPKPIGWDFCS